MKWILIVTIISLLCVITYQDFKFRAVSWILFPVLAALGTIYFYLSLPILKVVFFHIGLNISFILIQLGLLWAYFYLKEKKGDTLFNKKLGWGDVLFLFMSCCFFSFYMFITFYVLSIFLSLIFFLSFQKSRRNTTIPLAGLQSIILITAVLLNAFLPLSRLVDY